MRGLNASFVGEGALRRPLSMNGMMESAVCQLPLMVVEKHPNSRDVTNFSDSESKDPQQKDDRES